MTRVLGAFGAALFGALVLVSALAVREAERPTTAESAAGAARTPAPSVPPLRSLRLEPAYASQSARISPDGTYLTAMTADWKELALLALEEDPASGSVGAREIARVSGASGQAWLTNPTALVVALPDLSQTAGKPEAKRALLRVLGTDGSAKDLGAVELAGAPGRPSPDGRWIAVAEGVMQPGQIRVIDRSGASPPRVVASGIAGLIGWLEWDQAGRLLYAKGQRIVAVDLTGHETTYAVPTEMSANIVVGLSPDRTVAVVGVNVKTGEDLRLLVDDQVRPVPNVALRPLVWVGPRELLARHDDGSLYAVNALGGERDLHIEVKAQDVKVLGYQTPFLLWIDRSAARLHLTDLARGTDTTLGLNPLPDGAQPNGDGRFLLTRASPGGTELLSGPGWMASLPPTPAPVAVRAGASAGYRRIASDEGGWSMEIPEMWVAETAPLRGAEIASFPLRGADYSGNAPASDQMRIRVTLLPEYEGLPLDELGKRGGLSPKGPVIEQASTKVAGRDAVRTVMRPSTPPGPFDQLHVFWHLRSPYFTDRVLVVEAWPADGPLRAAADRTVGTVELFAPRTAVSQAISRAQAEANARRYPGGLGRVDRIATKLVSYREFEQAASFGRNYTIDPDELVWVVVTVGEFASVHSRPMPPQGVTPTLPPPDRLIVTVATASTGDSFGGMYSASDTWPAWFDSLKDRAP